MSVTARPGRAPRSPGPDRSAFAEAGTGDHSRTAARTTRSTRLPPPHPPRRRIHPAPAPPARTAPVLPGRPRLSGEGRPRPGEGGGHRAVDTGEKPDRKTVPTQAQETPWLDAENNSPPWWRRSRRCSAESP
ncbi:hypothetical protein GCM10010327_32540 [Streptomyces nitrosporeus]|nr:hypothetical protein GCM10010327_32540 [Streptomyces nitrosporeus]